MVDECVLRVRRENDVIMFELRDLTNFRTYYNYISIITFDKLKVKNLSAYLVTETVKALENKAKAYREYERRILSRR